MFEGRSNNSGWLLVGAAVVALVMFTVLLYARGGSGPSVALGGGRTVVATPRPSPSVGPSAAASGSAAAAKPTAKASAKASPKVAATGNVAGATSAVASDEPSEEPSDDPTTAPAKTAKPSAKPSAAATTSGYRLPKSPQKATVALANGQGDCPNFPTGGVVVETSFSLSSSGRLTANSPSTQRLTGRVQANGSFSLSGSNPVERWVGTLSESGGTGSYFIVSGGCTEGYETTIAFHN